MIHYDDDALMTEIVNSGAYTYETAIKFGPYCDVGHTTLSMEDFCYGNDFTTHWLYEDQIISLQTTDSVYDSNPCIGAAVAKTLTAKVSVGAYSTLTYMGNVREVWVATRCWKSHEPNRKTDWHYIGPFLEDRRHYEPETGILTVYASDAMTRSDSPYMKIIEAEDGDISYGRHCFHGTTDQEQLVIVIGDIAQLMGLNGTTTATDQMMSGMHLPRPDDDTTMRDIIRYAAGACGCNARIRWAKKEEADVDYVERGYLEFVPFNWNRDYFDVGTSFASVSLGDDVIRSQYFDVAMLDCADGNDHVCTHTAQDRVFARFQMSNPMGTEALCNSVLSFIRQTGDESEVWEYRGINVQQAMLDMRAEAGDKVQVMIYRYDGSYELNLYLMGTIIRNYDHLCTANIVAPDLNRRQIDPYLLEDWQQ